MIRPIGNYILCKVFKDDAVSAGGIIVPESYRVDGNKIDILAVGEGTNKTPMKIGKGIAYRIHNSGIPFDYNGEKYYFLEQSSILALEN